MSSGNGWAGSLPEMLMSFSNDVGRHALLVAYL